MKPSIDYTLYMCTDRSLMSCKTIEESVELAIAGGVSVVQLREKNCTSREFYELGKRVLDITKTHNVPLIINDRLDLALAIGAQGVHVGQKDLPAKEVRRIAGNDFIIGITCKTVEQAIEAYEGGADYMGVGAMFATGTKADAIVTSHEMVKKIHEAVPLPFVLIGGIKASNIAGLTNLGASGFAVVSGIVAQPDITKAAQDLRKIISSGQAF